MLWYELNVVARQRGGIGPNYDMEETAVTVAANVVTVCIGELCRPMRCSSSCSGLIHGAME